MINIKELDDIDVAMLEYALTNLIDGLEQDCEFSDEFFNYTLDHHKKMRSEYEKRDLHFSMFE
ncbi:MAG: hypothetical protein ACW98W_20395 [Candidatus Hodarchaeales archaeon]|jgi:hypothetical protein